MTSEVMKILTGLEPLRLHVTRTPPWNQSNPILQNKRVNHPKFHLIRNWRIHADAKGFNRAPTSMLQQKDKENDERKSYRRNNGTDDEDDKIPEVVWERIMFRIVFYVGVPLVIGLSVLYVFSAVKEQNLWDVPNWLPFLTTFLTFGASTLGIAYGTLSTSWDPQREGSFLGFEEAQKNWVEMWKEEEEDKDD